ncbi:hypothetical protein M9Y10_026699 [Tritrichomonas musculus]|uniref:Protein kinase domain-containing protein n=1 Tax=Tritrichomonas musculus TaxID=1915356 RepID=A0ABR2H7Q1_9EUKA
MNLPNYLDCIKKIYDLLTEYIDDDLGDSNYEDLIDLLNKAKIIESKDELCLFLKLLIKIVNYHHRKNAFFEKISKLIESLNLTRIFSNNELFHIFKSNKIILLILFEKQILRMDKTICNYISQKCDSSYLIFFQPEIKSVNLTENIKKEPLPDNFEFFRHIGENESYICQLIRDDSIEEFISYATKTNLDLSLTIRKSAYESNPLFLRKDPSLIEYAAFYGSIQIFRFLRLSDVEITDSIWTYAIHSDNGDLIHLIESDGHKIKAADLEESIKCHHNGIALYLFDVLLEHPQKEKFLVSYAIKHQNFSFFPDDFLIDSFYDLCTYNYVTAVDLLLKENKFDFIDSRKAFKSAADNEGIDVTQVLLNHEVIDTSFFTGCKKLKQIMIPSFVTEIKPSSFQDCSSLEKVIFEDSQTLKSIGEHAFSGCSELTELTIPESVTNIADSAFSGCSSLTQMVIPSSVESIGWNTFKECHLLAYVSLPSSITMIDNFCFDKCISLTKVFIPSSVTSIGYNAFRSCSSLVEIIIPSSVTSIGYSAFKDCSALQSICIPSSVNDIGNSTFSDCTSLNEIVLPSSINQIEESTFSGCKSLLNVKIPDSVTIIETKAFYGCSSLKQITIPSSVVEICENCFLECSSLEKITVNPYLTKIHPKAFKRCPEINTMSIDSSVTSVEKLDTKLARKVDYILIPHLVKIINEYAFTKCENLKKIVIPDSVTTISSGAFCHCSSLQTVTFSSSLSNIADSAFAKCEKLEEIEIPDSVSNISSNAFSECSSLRLIKISSNLIKIESKAFYNCKKLSKIDFKSDSSLTNIEENAFESCSNLEEIKLPSSVKSIGTNCFLNCSSLKEITLPCDTKIGENVFDGCSLALKKIFIDSTKSKENNCKSQKECSEFDTKFIWSALYECEKYIQKLESKQNRPIILLLGNTGVGKSTLSNILLSRKIKYNQAQSIPEYSYNNELNLIAPKSNDTKKLINIYGIAHAMHHLHECGIIHRDLKPENILIDTFNYPAICDFGLSSTSITNRIWNHETIKYIASHIIQKSEYDAYSFGILLYEILANRHPRNKFKHVLYEITNDYLSFQKDINKFISFVRFRIFAQLFEETIRSQQTFIDNYIEMILKAFILNVFLENRIKISFDIKEYINDQYALEFPSTNHNFDFNTIILYFDYKCLLLFMKSSQIRNSIVSFVRNLSLPLDQIEKVQSSQEYIEEKTPFMQFLCHGQKRPSKKICCGRNCRDRPKSKDQHSIVPLTKSRSLPNLSKLKQMFKKCISFSISSKNFEEVFFLEHANIRSSSNRKKILNVRALPLNWHQKIR